MLVRLKLARLWLVGFLFLTAVIGLAAVFSTRAASGGETADRTIARGGGTTIIQGGTGPSGGFIPVLTSIASRRKDRRRRDRFTRVSGVGSRSRNGLEERSVHRECNVRHWADHRSYRTRRYCDLDWHREHHGTRSGLQRSVHVCSAKRRARCHFRAEGEHFARVSVQ